MKSLFTVSIFAVALLLLQPAALCAQVKKRPSREAMDSLLNPKLCPAAEKILLFEKKVENIGTIAESDSARVVQFVFRNVSNKPVTITRVTTHCGCTTAKAPLEPVAAGASAVIAVKYNPKGRSGTIDTNAFVYADCAGSAPVAKLTILGNVVDENEWSHLPCVMGTLRLKRTKITFREGRTVARIPCANVGKKPLELKAAILPVYATFATEPKVVEPGEEADLVVSINPAETGSARRFAIVVDGVSGAISSRTINAIIE